MSFILDALKRADQERRQEPLEVGLDLHSEPSPPEPASRRPLAMGILAVGVLALALTLGLVLWPSERTSSAAPASASATPASPSPQGAAPSPEPKTTSQEAVPKPQPGPTAEGDPEAEGKSEAEDKPTTEVESLYANTEPLQASDDEAVEQLYQQKPQPRPRNPRLDSAEPVAASVTRLPTPAKSQVSEPEPEPARADNPRANLSAPAIRDLPWAMQQKIPSISYATHRYTDGGNSSVVLNGRELREGSKLTNALKVEEILADGVILSFEGRRFKLPAQSSWVNM